MLDLHLPEKTRAALDVLALPDAAYWKNEFWADSPAFADFAAASPDGLEILKVYQLAAEDMAARYAALGIPDAVLHDSLLEFGIWSRDYLAQHGRPGLSEWQWLGLTLRGRLFRLGRLQFEPSALTEPLGGYPAGTPVIEVHIPAGPPLDTGAVQASLAAAPGFFQRYFGTQYLLFHCYSWLMSPQLTKILPPDSRILQFQRLFTIAAWDETHRQAEQRVFGSLQDDPAAYPQQTRLQAALKEFMLTGEKPGVGHGLRRIEEK